MSPAACISRLACPVCAEPLTDAGASARCPAGHSFDYARSGYLNLIAGGAHGGRRGDSAAMVEARAGFLAGGHYEPIAAAVGAAARAAGAGPGGARNPVHEGDGIAGARAPLVLAELGAGTGHYLAAAAAALGDAAGAAPCGFGFDLSKAAAAHASRRHPELRFVVADVEAGIPLRDGAADLALSVFAPRPGPELGRVLRPGGELIAAFAGPRHLGRLRERLGLLGVHPDKPAQLEERLRPWFEPGPSAAVEYELDLSADDARRLVAMGPNAWHEAGAAATLEGGLTDLVSVTVSRFRRLPGPPSGVGPGEP